MRADVKGNLEREVRRRRDARVKDQVMKALLENSSVELPKALVEMEIERLMEGMRRDLEARGLKSGSDSDARRGLRAGGEASG